MADPNVVLATGTNRLVNPYLAAAIDTGTQTNLNG
jgi:hypothetical protein